MTAFLRTMHAGWGMWTGAAKANTPEPAPPPPTAAPNPASWDSTSRRIDVARASDVAPGAAIRWWWCCANVHAADR